MNFKNFYSRSPLDFWFGDPFMRNNYMRTDIYEKDGDYIIEIDMPGYSKENIHIGYVNGYINISAVKEQNVEDKNYIQKERNYGEYIKNFYVGKINEDEIKANFIEGILRISFPNNEVIGEIKKYINIE